MLVFSGSSYSMEALVTDRNALDGTWHVAWIWRSLYGFYSAVSTQNDVLLGTDSAQQRDYMANVDPPSPLRPLSWPSVWLGWLPCVLVGKVKSVS